MRRFRRNPTEDEKAAIAAELAALKKQQQGSLLDDLNRARAHGDLRENFEYHAAKEALRMAAARQKLLMQQLTEQSTPLSYTQEALIGKIIVYNDLDLDRTKVVQVVPQGRGDPANCLVDVRSPLVTAIADATQREAGEAEELLRQTQNNPDSPLRAQAMNKFHLLMPYAVWVDGDYGIPRATAPLKVPPPPPPPEHIPPGKAEFYSIYDHRAIVPMPYEGMPFYMVMDRRPPQSGGPGLVDPVVRSFSIREVMSTKDTPAQAAAEREALEAAVEEAAQKRAAKFKERVSDALERYGAVRENPVIDLTLRRHAAELKKKLSPEKIRRLRHNLQAMLYGSDPGGLAYQYESLSNENITRLIYLLADA
jgi:transcription elongation factor GreA